MKVPIKILRILFEKYGDIINVKYLSDLTVKGRTFLSKDLVLEDHLRFLAAYDIKEVDVFYDQLLYEYLSTEFPVEYRVPYGSLNFMDMDRHLEILTDVHNMSRRKRYIHIIDEIYGADPATGKTIPVIHHNEAIDYRKWNNMKREISKNQMLSYRNSEVAIILFMDLTMKSKSEYVEHFKKNIDLVSTMVSEKTYSGISIAPDFIPTEDIISVTDPGKLLEEYIRHNARLIIVGEKLNDSFKDSLIDVKKYDKFVRMLVIPNLDCSNLQDFVRQVKLVYNSERWL